MRKIIDGKDCDTDKAEKIVENEKCRQNTTYDKAIIYKAPNDTLLLHELNTPIARPDNKPTYSKPTYIEPTYSKPSKPDKITVLSIDEAVKKIYEWHNEDQIDADTTKNALEALGQKIEDA